MYICIKPYNNKYYTCFYLHMQKSHQGTDFHLFGSVWSGLGTILTNRMAKVNALKQEEE